MTRQREINTGDMNIPQPPIITMPNLNEDMLEKSTSIAAVDSMPNKSYMDELKFNEEMLTIRLERTGEKNPAKQVQIGCNGQILWIDIGKTVQIPRKFVEVLAGAQPMEVQTNVVEIPNQDPQNNVQRLVRAGQPFSVIHDANPKGAAWLTWLLARG